MTRYYGTWEAVADQRQLNIGLRQFRREDGTFNYERLAQMSWSMGIDDQIYGGYLISTGALQLSNKEDWFTAVESGARITDNFTCRSFAVDWVRKNQMEIGFLLHGQWRLGMPPMDLRSTRHCHCGWCQGLNWMADKYNTFMVHHVIADNDKFSIHAPDDTHRYFDSFGLWKYMVTTIATNLHTTAFEVQQALRSSHHLNTRTAIELFTEYETMSTIQRAEFTWR